MPTLILLPMVSLQAQNIQNLRLTTGTENSTGKQKQSIVFSEPWDSPYHPDPQFPRHFVNSTGKHVYVLDKMALPFFACDDPESFLEKTVKEGCNVIRVCLEGTVCQDNNPVDLWPWGGSRSAPDFDTFSPVYWNIVEERIRLAGDMGVGIHLVLYHSLHPPAEDSILHKSYWKHAIDRLGEYSNLIIWEMASSATENEGFVDQAGEFFKKYDTNGRAVMATGSTSDKAFWVEKPWMDLAVTTTKTGKEDFFGLDNWYLAIARNLSGYSKPVLNAETGSEELHGNNDPVYRRKQMWLWCGAGGYWTWNSLAGCREITQTTYFGPGWQYLKPMVEFYESIEFWRLQHDHTSIHIDNQGLVYTAMSTADKSQIIAYVCTSKSNDYVRDQTIGFRLPEGTFEMQFIRPSDKRPVRTDRIFGTGSMVPAPVKVPDFSNDLLIRIDKLP